METAQIRLLEGLIAQYPDAKCALNYTNAFELVVATVLSAQTTDVRVNSITPELFDMYPTPAAMASARPEDLEKILRSLGFQGRRALQLIGLAGKLEEEFDGEVPSTRAALESLPGVGRKTAHVVLGNYFGGSYLTVDTHVGRLARRFGWTTHTDPLRAEKDIVAHIDELRPGTNLTKLSHQIIDHGRALCTAKAPACDRCPLRGDCPQIL